MSVITIEVAQEQEQTLINFLKTLPYVKVQEENLGQPPKSDWRKLRGAHKHITTVSSESLARENEEEKEREKRQGMW